MNQKKEVVLKNGCQLVCDKCERERAQRTKSCGVCGCKETKEICLAIPGEEIVPSINIVKESQNQWYV